MKMKDRVWLFISGLMVIIILSVGYFVGKNINFGVQLILLVGCVFLIPYQIKNLNRDDGAKWYIYLIITFLFIFFMLLGDFLYFLLNIDMASLEKMLFR
jgi:hypothetical protein